MIKTRISAKSYVEGYFHSNPQKGITLISLIMTVIILLILSTITIGSIRSSNNVAPYNNMIADITLLEDKILVYYNKYGELPIGEEDEKIDGFYKIELGKLENITLNFGIDTTDKEDIYLVNDDLEVYYKKGIEKSGKVFHTKYPNGDGNNLLIKCVDTENTLLAEYNYLILKKEYSKICPKISGYEAEFERIEGTIEEDTIITITYYQTASYDSCLIFTGLDSNGNMTTDESSIASYMVGNNSTVALTDNTVEFLEIPSLYKGKPVISIGKGAFTNCNIIKKIILGENIKSIPDNSFQNCKNLKSVTLNGSYINIWAFNNCSSWTEINLNDNNYYKVDDNILYSLDGKSLVLCPTGRTGDFLVPDEVETIEEGAFGYGSLSSITVSDNVKTIKKWGMYGNKIEVLTLGKNLQSMSGDSLVNCSKLKIVILKSKIPNIWAFRQNIKKANIIFDLENEYYINEDDILYTRDKKSIVYYPFNRSENTYTITSDIDTIEEGAFSYVTNLETVSVNAKTIGIWAFYGASIKEITIGENVEQIIGEAFKVCNSLKTVTIDSASIVNKTDTTCQYLLDKSEEVYIREDISGNVGSYILNNFTEETSDKDGYVKYIRK